MMNDMPHMTTQRCHHRAFYPFRRTKIHACRLKRHRDPRESKQRCNRSWRRNASAENGAKEDVLGSLEEQFPFSPPKRPKFQAFVGQTEAGRLLMAFRHKCEAKEGHLLLRPLTQDNLSPATELLAESFAEAVGYMLPYRGFLKQQVREYLYSHLSIAPKAIILEALLLEDGFEEEDVPPQDDASPLILRKAETAVSWLDEKTYLGDAAQQNETQEGATSGLDSNPLQNPQPLQAAVQSVSDAMLPGQESEAAPASSPSELETVSEDAADGLLRNQNCANDKPETIGEKMARQLGSKRKQLEGNGSFTNRDSGSVAAEPSENIGEGGTAGESDAEAEALERRQGKLVGTVELSFASSTRTKSMTLNPPDDAAYLCNMAVDENYQRRGYARAMLAAVEDLIQLTGFRRVWLHVRLKDEAAQALYQQAGFGLEQEDWWIVGFFNDRRKLLSKFVPRKKEPPQQAQAPVEEPEEVVAQEF